MAFRIILGIVLGGILGCIATGAAVALIAGGDFVGFVTTWGKHGVSIAIACLLPFIFAVMGRFSGIVFGIIVLDLVAAAITMFVYGGPGWVPVLGFNAVYAVVATLVYAALAGSHRRRLTA